MIVVYGTLLWNDDVSRGCFLFFKIFILCVVKGEGSGGVKGKKMVQNEKFCLSGSISQESYIIWFWFMVLMCKMIIYPEVFFILFKILIFWVVRRVKGQKIGENDKNFCLSCLISQEPFIIWSSFLVHMCKMVISPSFFLVFSKFDFLGC